MLSARASLLAIELHWPFTASQIEHLINYTGPTGFARQRIEAGEGRREMEEDLALLYSTVLKCAASQQALAAMSNRAVDSPQGGYRAVADKLRPARWIRVPAPGGGDELHFVTAAQLCFDLAAPHGDFFPPPDSLCDDVPLDNQRSLLLTLGAVSAQQGASLPPPLPADAASRQVSRSHPCNVVQPQPCAVTAKECALGQWWKHQPDTARMCRACSRHRHRLCICTVVQCTVRCVATTRGER